MAQSDSRPELRRQPSPGAPLRLCLILGQLDRGGSEGQALALASGLAGRGHDVRLFSFRDGARRGETPTPCRVPAFPFAGLGLAACARWLRGSRPEAVYTFGARGHSWGRLAARIAGVRHLLVGYRQQRDYWLDPLTLGWNDAIVCNARAVAAHVARRYPRLTERVRVIPNGVDAERFSRTEAVNLAALGLRRPFIAQTARLHANKDHETALRALDIVRRAHASIQLALVGDGPLCQALQRRARSLGLGERVRFLGSRPDVAPILAAAAVGWLSSRREGSPNAVLEYMAAGLPVVATRAGGTEESLREGRDGFLCAIGDAEAMAERTLRLLEDEGLRARFGAAGRQRAAGELSLATMVERTEALLREVVAEGAGRGNGHGVRRVASEARP